MAPIFDFDTLKKRRTRAAGLLATVQPVLDDLAERLLDRLDDTPQKFARVLEIGGRGSIAPGLRARGMAVTSADFCAGPGVLVLNSAEDFGLPEGAYDLVVAHLAFHGLDDLPGAFIQCRRALRPGGLFLATMPVLGTLQELREALLEAEEALTGGVSPRVAPFPALSDAAGLLQRAGFALPVADVEDISLLYARPLELLHELRAAGETNILTARSRRIPPRALFAAALSALPQEQGRTRATLRLAVLTGWAPDALTATLPYES